MALINDSETRDVYGINDEEKRRIIAFLQGAVYCWCKNKPGQWFSMRDLMGGENFNWAGTPLFALYEKHEEAGKDTESAIEDAGKDSGWLLKKVIKDDRRLFDTKQEDYIRKYIWIKDDKS